MKVVFFVCAIFLKSFRELKEEPTEQLGLTCKKLSPHRVVKHLLSLPSYLLYVGTVVGSPEWMGGWMGLEQILRIYFAFPGSFLKI